MVSNRDAVIWTRRLVHDEGLFVGVSTGAVAKVAARVANELEEGDVVFIASDDGWKYLSSGIYTAKLTDLEEMLETQSFW